MRRLIFIFSLMVIASTANADCVSDCQASTYCGGGSYECAQLQNECYRRECAKNGGDNSHIPIRQGGAYGAIAYDEKSGSYGLADASTDKKSAKKSALGYCSRRGSDCEVEETFDNTCAVIAQSVDGTVAWAMDDNRMVAGREAVKDCNKKSSDHLCHIALMHCYAP